MGREQRDKKVMAITNMNGDVVGIVPKPITEVSIPVAPTDYQIIISTGMNTQEEIRTLTHMAKKGYEHYLTVPLYGSTEKLYFRSYK